MPSRPQQLISGAYTVTLSGPVDNETRATAREGALHNLKLDMLGWMRERYQLSCDTTNAIDRIHLDSFVRSCANRGKENSSFEGSEWTLSYRFTPQKLDSLVTRWNALYDTLALEAYRELTETVARGERRQAYVQGVQTVFYAKAHIGPPLNVPGELAKDLVEAARSELQTALGEMVVSTSGMVISGKPGSPPQNQLTLQIKLDTIPFPGVSIAAFLPSGRKLMAGRTDAQGSFSFARMRLPYVANGTFLYARPNPGAVVDTAHFFTFKEMGLRLSRNPEQTLMFKLTRPTFSLKYRARKVNNLDIPTDFADRKYLAAFIRDSCHFDPAPNGAVPDVVFDIACQVSSYTYDRTEETVLKAEAMIRVDEKNNSSPRTLEHTVTHKKSYEWGTDIPTGLFFWETAAVLQQAVKAALRKL